MYEYLEVRKILPTNDYVSGRNHVVGVLSHPLLRTNVSRNLSVLYLMGYETDFDAQGRRSTAGQLARCPQS